MRFRYVLGIVCLFSFTVQAQETVTVQAAKDCGLYETDNGSLSNGVGEFLFVGKIGENGNLKKRRALLKFDLAGLIPEGSTIVSAELNVTVTKANNNDGQGTDLFRVTADWGEGTSNGGATGAGVSSTPGDATWIHRFFDTTSWAAPGGDFAGEASAHVTIGAPGLYSFQSTPQMVSDVQGWLNNPSTNFGWILIVNEAVAKSVKVLGSRENSTAANRPSLTVQYTGSTGVIGSLAAPLRFSLGQNFPNPFNPSTVIRYSIPAASHVSLKVFDILGKEIAVLVNERKEAGSFTYEWSAAGLPSGIYFYRLQSADNGAVKKLVLTK